MKQSAAQRSLFVSFVPSKAENHVGQTRSWKWLGLSFIHGLCTSQQDSYLSNGPLFIFLPIIGLFPSSLLEIHVNHDVMVMHQTKGAFPTKGNQTGPQCLLVHSVPQTVPADISALTGVMVCARDEVSVVGLHCGHLLVGKQLRPAKESCSPYISGSPSAQK